MILLKAKLAIIGLFLAAWVVAAIWAIVVARGRERRAEAGLANGRRLARMLEESPAVPLLVRVDGRIEAPQRLADWLGLDKVPQYLSELDAGLTGLTAETIAQLTDAVRATQKSAAPFRMIINPRGSSRSLALRGHLADPQISPGGAALIWVFDFSDSESELVALRAEAEQVKGDFAALSGLIEAAPLPMWFRKADGTLRLVNAAYVDALGAPNAAKVVDDQIELIEASGGASPAELARKAVKIGQAQERLVSATINGQRRALKVSDLPLGDAGIAGYAIDIEDMEEQTRAFRAFRHAQRALLDQLASGVAQFDSSRQLTFANQPFQRIFALGPQDVANAPNFDRFLDAARNAARLPEVRDFPAWRRERGAWFTANAPQDEAWPLANGTHLRVVAQPQPDGGLLLIVEDRTEQLQLSATRDTLLRTRTASFDSLFEAVAVFAPDGRLQLWNRSFAAAWGLDNDLLDQHPRIDALLERIAPALAKPAKVKAIGDVVRAAALDRKQTGGRANLADGRVLEFAGVPLPDGNGLLTVLDVTDSHKAADALQERNAALMEADALKTRFLANMSYEFRTPLTSIGGFAELLGAGLGGDLSDNGREYVDAILQSVGRLGEQIENVLDLSQSEAGMLPLAQEKIELLPFITQLVEERGKRLDGGGLTLSLKGDKGAGAITGDPRRLERAIGHVLDNAITATPAGGRILVELSRRKVKKHDWARVVISDNGPGLDAASLARALGGIKLAADGKSVERRQGLGLPLARQLIEAHGGHFEMVSEPGQGTTVLIDLP